LAPGHAEKKNAPVVIRPRHGERNDRTRAAGSSAAWGRRIFRCGERTGGAIEDKLSPPGKNKNPQKPHKWEILLIFL
ncbi:hypothetical protein, partial [Pseudomonas aeruginosa]|uniref:hypothetical protein n=1 Tax=Pseudomonas aeruginosa TaxID=287 RepID=UPI001F256479